MIVEHSEIALRKNRFSKGEDELITKLVNEFGENSWHKISSLVQNRTPRQCKERWLNYLKQGINKTPWKKEEDELLIKKADELKKSWREIAAFFNGRTTVDLKNRYSLILRREKKSKELAEINETVQKLRNIKSEPKIDQSPADFNLFDSFEESFIGNESHENDILNEEFPFAFC